LSISETSRESSQKNDTRNLYNLSFFSRRSEGQGHERESFPVTVKQSKIEEEEEDRTKRERKRKKGGREE
jgi:hypothetical protein